MDIIDKFTNHLKSVLTRSLCLVLETGGGAIEPKHLLWALGTEPGSMGSQILERAGVKGDALGDFAGVKEGIILPEHVPPQAPSPLLSDESKKAIEKAVLSASIFEHRYIGTEHLLYGLIQAKSKDVTGFLKKHAVKTNQIEEQIAQVFKSAATIPEIQKGDKAIQQCEECGGFHDLQSTEEKTALEYFTVELTHPDRVKNIDVLVGREEEVDRLAAILSRRTKNNPLLLGEPGVGKTAIVEGLAKRIADKQAPAALIDKKIYLLDMASLVAGAMYRGDFEARLTDLLQDLRSNPSAILFIDEIHTIIGTGSASGSLDAANMLKPALARGEIKVIGATTLAEYKKHIETDGALSRRFASVTVREPNAAETLNIVQGLASEYAKHHRVTFTADALKTIVDIAERYFPHKAFPDKAIDLMDEAGSSAGAHLPRKNTSAQMDELKKKIETAKTELGKAVSEERFPDAAELKHEQMRLTEELTKLEKESEAPLAEVDEDLVRRVASRISGVPLEHLTAREHDELATLHERLAKHVIAQDEAVAKVAEAVRRAKLGFSREDKPLASFLFVGPSGVGKTELAKALAHEVFGDKKALVRLDMSEYAEGHTVSKLIGSPAGYVGYREGAKLTDAVKNKPYSVILFDELEKAHRDVHNLLLQILDEGTLTDSTGAAVNFRNAIIIMTTNAGREQFERGALGFGSNTLPEIKDIRPVLEDAFKPELLNRIDRVCLFAKLDKPQLEKIAAKELADLIKRLEKRGISLSHQASITKTLANAVNPKLGARDVRRVIEELVERPLADSVLENIKSKKAKYKILTNKKGAIEIR